jgi:hypothetical protein
LIWVARQGLAVLGHTEIRQFLHKLGRCLDENVVFKKNAALRIGNYHLGRCRHISDRIDVVLARTLGEDPLPALQFFAHRLLEPHRQQSDGRESASFLLTTARRHTRLHWSECPQRLGKPLVGELKGLSSAERGDYRIIYDIFEEDEIVVIHWDQHRRDVYRPR